MLLTRTKPDVAAPPTPERFGELFEEHSEAIYNFCFRRLADWALAEDMTSAVFLEAWRRRAEVDLVEEPPLPWLYGVATNLLRNHRRSLRRASAALARFHDVASVPDFGDELADRLDAERQMRAVRELVALLGLCGDPDEISRQLDAAVRRRGGEPLHLDLPLAPGRDCGPALPRRTALKVAMLGSIRGESFMPPAFMGCEESYGGVEQAPAGTNCSLGLGGPRAPDCPDGAQAEQLVRHALERRGLGDWRIVVVPPESFSSRYCYVYSRAYPERDEVRLRSMVDDPNR